MSDHKECNEALEQLLDISKELYEALKIVLTQFGPYQDGQGAAKYHAVNIANQAIAKADAYNGGYKPCAS